MARYVTTFIRSFIYHWRASRTRPAVTLPTVQYTRKATGTAKKAWTTPDMGRRGWGVSPPLTVSIWVIVFIIILICCL